MVTGQPDMGILDHRSIGHWELREVLLLILVVHLGVKGLRTIGDWSERERDI
jgi:hypothetical protein